MNTRVFLLLGLTTTLSACLSKHMEMPEPEPAAVVTDAELTSADAPEETVQREEMKDSVRQPVAQVVAPEPMEELDMDEDLSWADGAEAEAPAEAPAAPAPITGGDALAYDLPDLDRASSRTRAAPKRERNRDSNGPTLIPQSTPAPSGGEALDNFGYATNTVTPPTDSTSSAEEYTDYGVNGFTVVDNDALSTFSIDVDTASYTVSRRKLQEGGLPPVASVRVEEFVNYFDYDYPQPTGRHPFNVQFEAFPDPFRDGRHIMRVGVQGKDLSRSERPPLHLTFLIDVSGSMSSADKLGLTKQSLHMLVDTLSEGDTVAIATYAGRVAEVLSPTDSTDKRQIHDAIEALSSGGSTGMSSGIDLAYQLAQRTFEEGAENRVVVMSDGDANVGATSWDEMLSQIKGHADDGITLSTIGFGMGNYRDTLMEQLANNGDGNNYYIDSQAQAQRVFVEQMGSTIFTIARDVKLQVEFNDDSVAAYRLIGYENRDIADRDFRNDRVDAGEVGAGHTVTALYEVILKEGYDDTLASVHLRYEAPGADKAASEISYPFPDEALSETESLTSKDARIAYAAATFAEILRESPHANELSMDDLIRYTRKAQRPGKDDAELIDLMRSAQRLGAGAGTGVASR